MSAIQVMSLALLLGRSAAQCSASFYEDCSSTRCCKAPGMTCWRKNADWAECKPTCTPGIDHFEHKAEPWSCEKLFGGAPAPQVAAPTRDLAMCAAPYTENCRTSGCCKGAGMKCFEKDGNWGACKSSCTPGIDPNDKATFKTPWSCKVLTEPAQVQPTPTPAPSLRQQSSSYNTDSLANFDVVSERTAPSPAFVNTAQSPNPVLPVTSSWNAPASGGFVSNTAAASAQQWNGAPGDFAQPTARQRVLTFIGLYWPQLVCGFALLSSLVAFGGVAVLWWQNPMCVLTGPQVQVPHERIHILE